jgi:membrane-bound ClpP family serine protease
VREWILSTASHPTVAAFALVVGVIGIIAEFLLPARVIPGVLGGLLTLLGLWSLLPEHTGLAVSAMVPLSVVVGTLLKIAARARRNKRTQ